MGDAVFVVTSATGSLVAFFPGSGHEPVAVAINHRGGFGALCFGCGYLTAYIVTRNQWRDEMIKRGIARYHWQNGKWEWGERPKEPTPNLLTTPR
jgi:hypothetical protein